MPSKAQQIAQQNDRLRKNAWTRPQPNGKIVFTRAIADMAKINFLALAAAIIKFDNFNEGNNPYGENDFGEVHVCGERIFWKIDYYADSTCEWGAEDPADPSTYRIMTVMLASDY